MALTKVRGAGAEGLTLSSTALTVANGLTLTDGNVTLASGHGIDFSSTGDGSGTDSSELFDDYEEGTWTVNLYKDTSVSSALAVTTRYGYYKKAGGMIYVSFYWYRSGGLSSETNNSAVYAIKGLPYAVKDGTDGAYQFIPAGYIVVSNSTYYEDHRWQANATDTLTMYGDRRQTAHTSGVLEFSGSGVFMEDV